ncbi:hypothetical protein PDESU_04226 [Pontiella desulfatans]|uniref:Uncharacterized protein n=1 Tax=Pontiella desulfatans TaxID=2750659 RepID=A0A6C2U7Z6_PONDE|nr:hypothetical protein [Pontiella desulfatans]VGO15641.1 hypothetical protein PDESU_04226 [Pontiella desulfatans]
MGATDWMKGLLALLVVSAFSGCGKDAPPSEPVAVERDVLVAEQEPRVVIEVPTPRMPVQLDGGVLQLGHNEFSCKIHQPGSALKTVAAITSPAVKFAGPCLTVDVGLSEGLAEIPWGEALELDALPHFAFFSPEKTTVGLFLGTSDQTIGTTQRLFFLDTKTDRRVMVMTRNRVAPDWIVGENGLPVGVRELRWDTFGLNVARIHDKPRVARCWRFEGQRKLRDREMEQALFAEAFDKIKFEPNELDALRAAENGTVPPELGTKLIDAVYYGARLGQTKETAALLENVHPSLGKQLFPLLDNPDGYAPEVGGFAGDPAKYDQLTASHQRFEGTITALRGLLRKPKAKAAQDFVSGYDFTHAAAADLPWESAGSIKLLGVSDANSDGFMDAILFVDPGQAGAGARLSILSRKQAGGKFSEISL